MLMAWLNQPIWLQFLLLAAGYLAIAAVLFVVTFGRWTRRFAQTLGGVSPSYVSVPATLLALLTGFVANDAWNRESQATRVVQSEGDNVLAAYELARAATPNDAAIRVGLQAYVSAVIDEEWPAMAKGSESPKADEALDALLRQVSGAKTAEPSRSTIQSTLLGLVLRIRSDRGTRLALNDHQADGPKWLTLLILGVLTQTAIAVIHIDRPRAQIAAMLIFTTALVSTLGLVAIHEWPFDGPTAIQPKSLIAAAQRLRADAARVPPEPSTR